MQNNYWAILVKVHFWFKIHSWPAIMVRILNFRFNANIVFPCCIWPGPVRQKRHCPTLVSARCSINVLWISNIVTTLGQYLALFGYPGISRGSATPDIRFSLILTPFLDGTGTFCPSPSAPALLSQTFCPSPSVPDVLSRLSVPGQNVLAWDRKASPYQAFCPTFLSRDRKAYLCFNTRSLMDIGWEIPADW